MRERRTRGEIAAHERSLLTQLLRPRGWLAQILFEVALTGVGGLVGLWLHGG